MRAPKPASLFHQIIKLLPAAVLVAAVAVSIAQAAPAKKAAPKPSAKPAVKPAAKKRTLIREVLGTQPLTGYEGSFGETFTLGKNTPLNFTLNKAEYAVSRVNIGDYAYFPKADEKLLVLHFTIHNPQKKNLSFSSGQLIFKAIDSGGVTREAVSDVGREVTGESLRIDLHPGQKIDAYTAIKVAAYGEVPKLIVQNNYERETPIIRYDLRDKPAKLAAPFVDPEDAKGVTPLKLVPAKAGEFYPVTDFLDARLDSISYSTEAISGVAPGTANRYCNAIYTLKNKGRRSARYSYSFLRADLKDADGDRTDYNTSMLKASRDEQAGGELQPGEEVRVRFYFKLPEKATAKTILLQYGYDRESRTYAYDAESIAPQ